LYLTPPLPILPFIICTIYAFIISRQQTAGPLYLTNSTELSAVHQQQERQTVICEA
jgi:hypothetical protein